VSCCCARTACALTRPSDAAAELAKFALDSGGLDNITVVLVPFPPRPNSAEEPTTEMPATELPRTEQPTVEWPAP